MVLQGLRISILGAGLPAGAGEWTGAQAGLSVSLASLFQCNFPLQIHVYVQFSGKKMAANFWLSTHCKYWLLTKEDLIISAGRQEDLKYLTADEYQKIHILFANFIQALGEHLKHRQQVIAAATHYFKRFYSKNSLKNIDPLLLAPTCLYLASKVEENGVISNNRLIQTCATVVKNKFMTVFNIEYPYRINQV